VPEHESIAERLVENRGLAAEQELVGKIAADPPQQRVGDTKHRRPVQTPGELGSELFILDPRVGDIRLG